MSITYVSSSTATSSTANSLAVSEPASVAENDLYIALCTIREDTEVSTWSTPSGWTKLAEETTGGLSTNDGVSAIFYRFRGATAVGDTTFTSNATADRFRATISAYRGVDTTTPFDVTYSTGSHYNATANTLNAAAPAITTATNNAAVILINWLAGSFETDIVGGAPSGYDLDYGIYNEGFRAHSFARRTIATAGTETPGVWTHTSAATTFDPVNYTLALKPAAAVNLYPTMQPLYYGETRLANKTGIEYTVRGGHGLDGSVLQSSLAGTTDASGNLQFSAAIAGTADDPVTVSIYWEEGTDPTVDRSLIVQTTLAAV